MTVALSDFTAYISPHAEGAPSPLITQQLRLVARDFCVHTEVVRQAHAAIDAVADQAAYTLTEPAGHQIVALTEVIYADRWVTPVSRDWLDTEWPQLGSRQLEHYTQIEQNWREVSGTQPYYAFQPSRTSVQLVPKPSAALTNAIEIEMALQPTLTATTFDDVLFDEHLEALMAGVLANLLMMPNRPWTDQRAAIRQQAAYEMRRDAAKGLIIRSRGRASRTVGRVKGYDA